MIVALVAAAILAQTATDAPTTPATPIATPTPTATALPADAAVIRNSGSTNTAPYEIVVVRTGDATVVQFRSDTHARLAGPQTRWLFHQLARAPALDTFAGTTCMKSASFGTSTTIEWNGHRSPDISCPGGDAALRELARIADVIVAKLGVSTRRSPRRLPL